jgi:hypothetical protein
MHINLSPNSLLDESLIHAIPTALAADDGPKQKRLDYDKIELQ